MAGGKVLAVLGAVVVTAVAAALWLAMSEDVPGDGSGTAEAASTEPAATTKPDKETGPKKPQRKHAQATGSSSVIGTIKRRADAAAAAGQVVTLTRQNMDPWTATADAAGSFRIPDLGDGGPYELCVEAKGCGTIRLPGLELTRGEAFDVGTLWLDLAVSVTVSVRTWGDVPIEGAEVEAFAAPDWNRAGFDWSRQQALLSAVPVAVSKAATGKDGKAVFPEMAAGVWTFAARKDGLAKDGRSNVRLEGGSEPPEVKIFLATGHSLKGRVLDGDKRPIANASVVGGRTANVWDFGGAPLKARTKSDAEGRYELTALPTGDVALQVGVAGGIPFQAAMVRVPAVSQYDLIVRSGGSLVGTVTESASGKPIEGAVVRANSYGAGGQRMAEATTDAAGKYLIAAVADGPVNDISVTKDGWLHDRGDQSPMRGQIQLNPGDTITRDFKMKQGGKVAGVVSGAQGPVAGARVMVWTMTPMTGVVQSKAAFTDSAGKYEVSPVERGKGMVQVTKEGMVQKGLSDNWQQTLYQGVFPQQYKVEVPEQGEVKLDVALDGGQRVEGKVEADGQPLAGATVTLYAGQNRQTAKSGADGTFVLTGANPGPKVNLMAQKDGFVPGRNDPVQVLQDQPTTGVVLKMVPQRMIKGKATSAAGVPLRDGQVSVIMKQQGQGGMQQQWYDPYQQMAQGTTAPIREDGGFEIAIPFSEGSIAVRAMALDHAPGESAAVAMVDTQTQYEANVILEAGYTIRGRVASKGVAVAAANVTIAPGRADRGNRGMPMGFYPGMNQNPGTIVAVTNAEGSFAIEHVMTGSYSVSASADGYMTASVPDVKVPTAGDVALDIEPSLEITGKVLFGDGKPAAGAMVSAQKDDPNNKNQQQGYWGGGPQGMAGADGSFKIRNLGPGGWRLTAQAPWDGSANVKNVTTEPVTAGTTDYKLLVQSGGTITGKVVDPEKKPVAGSWIYANPATQVPNTANEWHYGFSKKDGTFEITGLSDAPQNLQAHPPQTGDSGNFIMTSKENVAVGTANVEIVFEAGLTIEGSITDSNGKPVADAMLQIQWKHDPQNPKAQQKMNWNRQTTSTDAEGKFKFEGMGPGKYMVILQAQQGSRHDGLLLQGNDDIPAGSTGLALTASTGEKIAGVVVDEVGAPIQNVWVYANPQTGGGGRNGRTDKDGKFEISGLPRGVLNVGANAPNRPQVQAEKVEAGSLGVRIVMSKGGTITGRIQDGAGNAYANQNVQFKAANGQVSWAQTGADGRFTSQLMAEGSWDLLALRKNADGKGQEWVKIGNARTGETVDLSIP